MANQDIVKKTVAEAMKDLVREKEIDDITISDICERSHVNRRTFYRYFSDKFEVIEWIHYSDFLQKLQLPGESSLYYAMAASVKLVLEDRKYYINALKYRGQNSFRQYCARHLSNLCYTDFRDCFPSDDLYYIYIEHSIETAFGFFEYYLTTKPDLTEEELLQAFRDMYYYPAMRYVELLDREYEHPKGGSPYETSEPSRAQKK